MAARKGTKNWYFEKLDAVAKEGYALYDRLDKLVKEGRCTDGCLLTYGSWFTTPWYREISNLRIRRSTRRKTSVDMIRMWFELVERDVDRLRKFVEEQEALPFEETQKQVLIRKGELKLLGSMEAV